MVFYSIFVNNFILILCTPLDISRTPGAEEGYFEYGNFEFKNGNFEKQSGELKTKWGTKVGGTKRLLKRGHSIP